MPTIVMSLVTLRRECEERGVTLQYVLPGREPEELGADVVAEGLPDGRCSPSGSSLAGKLLLSLLAAGA